jgi:hypothetical protein
MSEWAKLPDFSELDDDYDGDNDDDHDDDIGDSSGHAMRLCERAHDPESAFSNPFTIPEVLASLDAKPLNPSQKGPQRLKKKQPATKAQAKADAFAVAVAKAAAKAASKAKGEEGRCCSREGYSGEEACRGQAQHTTEDQPQKKTLPCIPQSTSGCHCCRCDHGRSEESIHVCVVTHIINICVDNV